MLGLELCVLGPPGKIDASATSRTAAGPSRHMGDIIVPMLTASYRRAVFTAMLLAGACSRAPDPIEVVENTIVIRNQTSSDWRDVMITVNDHFRGGAPQLAAQGRLNAPLSQFQTGFGQRYEISRQNVFKVEVTAVDSAGEPVNLQYQSGRKR